MERHYAFPKNRFERSIQDVTYDLRERQERAGLVVGSHYAWVPQRLLDQLPEYSTSMPTGVYYGKVWKARVWNSSGRAVWVLRGYEYDGHPDGALNIQRRIIVPSGLLEQHLAPG